MIGGAPRTRTELSLLAREARGPCAYPETGAWSRYRPCDLLLFKQALYRLSYPGEKWSGRSVTIRRLSVGNALLFRLSYSRRNGQGRWIRTTGLLRPREAGTARLPHALMAISRGIEPLSAGRQPAALPAMFKPPSSRGLGRVVLSHEIAGSNPAGGANCSRGPTG